LSYPTIINHTSIYKLVNTGANKHTDRNTQTEINRQKHTDRNTQTETDTQKHTNKGHGEN